MDERKPSGAAGVESYLTALTMASKPPGIQYLVVRSTGVLFEHTSGWADIRRQMPVDTATTMMMAYSMSKTITAVAALQLVETGRVGLDDPVERYVESLPYGSSVTVRQLIPHTSGIPKRYERQKAQPSNNWLITLRPINAEFDPIVLSPVDEDKVQVIAEVIEVLG